MSTPPSSQDTPGRPKSHSSRQQSHPDQGTQTGAPEIDKRDAGEQSKSEAKRAYQDRPADEGKYGDGDEEPNPGPMSTDTRDLD